MYTVLNACQNITDTKPQAIRHDSITAREIRPASNDVNVKVASWPLSNPPNHFVHHLTHSALVSRLNSASKMWSKRSPIKYLTSSFRKSTASAKSATGSGGPRK